MGSSAPDDSVTWRLVEAKTNSPPFSVIGEAESTQLSIDVDLIAKNQKKAFTEKYNSLISGSIPESWSSPSLRKSAERFIARSLNGVAKTQIELDDGCPLVLTKQEAAIANTAFVKPVIELVEPYTQIGSIEATILEVGSHYQSPAIHVKERLTGDKIWCLVDEGHRKQIAEEADFDDVWSGRCVRIRGKLEYDQVGNISKVHASDISPIDVRNVSLSEIKDKDFTDGLSPLEYIDKVYIYLTNQRLSALLALVCPAYIDTRKQHGTNTEPTRNQLIQRERVLQNMSI